MSNIWDYVLKYAANMVPNLRLFRYAIAVADAQSFTRAAALLGIAQPPLSQQIARLETDLGFRLFERGRGGATLTPAGSVFIDQARLAIECAAETIARARQAAQGQVGTLRLGLSGASMFSFLPPLLREYRRQQPEVALALHNVAGDGQLAMLGAGRLDVGFTRQVPQRPGYAQEQVHAEPYVAALPAGHRFATRKRLDLSELAGEPFILFPDEGSGFYAEVMALCRAAGFTPEIAQTIAPMHAVLGLVSAGLGISVVPASVHVVAFAGVRYVSLGGLTRASRQFLVYLPAQLSPVAARFVAFVRQRHAEH